MRDEHRGRDLRVEQLTAAACLAHAVPGVTLRLHCTSGAALLVSSTCLGADLDPCALRAALVQDGSRPVAPAVTSVEFVAGLTPIGGGLHQRTVGAHERWFVTTLAPAAIVKALADGDGTRAGAEDAFARYGIHTIVRPDRALGVHAVGVRAGPEAPAAALDEAAVWALGRVAVTELLARIEHPSGHAGANDPTAPLAHRRRTPDPHNPLHSQNPHHSQNQRHKDHP